MPDTEYLQARLGEAHNEITDIRERGQKLRGAIAYLICAYAADHKCSQKSIDYAIEYSADALTDLLDDAEGPACRRATRIEMEIGDIESPDLYRSSPAVVCAMTNDLTEAMEAARRIVAYWGPDYSSEDECIVARALLSLSSQLSAEKCGSGARRWRRPSLISRSLNLWTAVRA